MAEPDPENPWSTLAEDLGAAATRLLKMKPVWQAVGLAIEEHVKQRFMTSTAPDGEPWAPLSENYAVQDVDDWGEGTGEYRAAARKRRRRRRSTGPISVTEAMAFAADGPRRRKRRARRAGRILIQTGRMMNGVFSKAADDGVTFGANAIYAGTHQFGSAPNSIPARPFLPVLPDGSTSFPPGTPAGELFQEIEETLMDFLDPDRRGDGTDAVGDDSGEVET